MPADGADARILRLEFVRRGKDLTYSLQLATVAGTHRERSVGNSPRPALGGPAEGNAHWAL